LNLYTYLQWSTHPTYIRAVQRVVRQTYLCTAESVDEESLPPGLRNRRSSARERVSASQARFSRESRKDRDLTPVRSRSKKAASASSSGGGHAMGRASVTTSESNYSHNSTINRITNILFEDDGASSLSKSKSSGSLIQNKILLPARSRTSTGPSPIAFKHVPVDSPRLSASTSTATRVRGSGVTQTYI
jgi:hypothetical protein